MKPASLSVRSLCQFGANVSRLSLLLVLAVGMGGCAFGARRATLHYPPAAEPGAGTARAAPAAAASKAEIALAPFADGRTDKKQVGSVRNGFGMPTADVVTNDSVPDWVTGAVRTELTKAGYRVIDNNGDAPTTPTLAGDITNVWCDAYFTYLGEVNLNVRLRRGSQDLLNKGRHRRGLRADPCDRVGRRVDAVGDRPRQGLGSTVAIHRGRPDVVPPLLMRGSRLAGSTPSVVSVWFRSPGARSGTLQRAILARWRRRAHCTWTAMTTRRFCARPAGVELSATGLSAPKPWRSIASSRQPTTTRY
jgi:hypothetical protein